MPVCPTSPASSNLSAALENLQRWTSVHIGVEAGRGLPLRALESQLQAQLAAIGRAALADHLAALDEHSRAVEIDGKRHVHVVRCEAQYHSAFGTLTVERNLFRPAGTGGRAVAPMDLRADLVATRWTPLAAKQATYLLAHCTAVEACEAIALFQPDGPSKSTLDRLSKQLGDDWEAMREPLMADIRAIEEVPEGAAVVAVALDGIMGLTRDCSRAEARAAARKRGKGGGPAGFREFGCGTLTFYNAKGERLLTRYIGRVPEARKQTLRDELQAELEAVLAERPDLIVCKLSDGAPDHWRFLCDELGIDGIEVLDFFHAAENLAHALRSAYGDGTKKFEERFATLQHKLRHEEGGVESVIRSLARLHRRFPKRRLILKHLKYFRNHRHRMQYATLARNCLPIGSGVVEAACKTLVTARLKRTGMRWSAQGAQAVLTFRALAKSERFDLAWSLFVQRKRRTVTQLDAPGLRLVG